MSVSGISWAISKSVPRPRQVTMPASHHSVFYRPDAFPATQPTASKNSTITSNIKKNPAKFNSKHHLYVTKESKLIAHQTGESHLHFCRKYKLCQQCTWNKQYRPTWSKAKTEEKSRFKKLFRKTTDNAWHCASLAKDVFLEENTSVLQLWWVFNGEYPEHTEPDLQCLLKGRHWSIGNSSAIEMDSVQPTVIDNYWHRSLDLLATTNNKNTNTLIPWQIDRWQHREDYITTCFIVATALLRDECYTDLMYIPQAAIA